MFLAFAFCIQLFEPFAEACQMRFIVCQDFHCFALFVEQIAQCRILIADVCFQIGIHVFLSCILCTFHHCIQIYACYSHRQQTNGCQYGETTANVVGDHECFVAFLIAHCFQCASCFVSCCKDSLCRFFFAVFVFQHFFEDTESDSGFCCCTGFGDYVYGEISVTQNCQNIIQICRADVVTHEINVGSIFFQFIVIRCFDKVQSCSCAQIRTADTDNDQHFAVGSDLFSSHFDTRKFIFIVCFRQVYPAYEIIAFTCFIVQILVAAFYICLQCIQLVQIDKVPLQGKRNTHFQNLLFLFETVFLRSFIIS